VKKKRKVYQGEKRLYSHVLEEKKKNYHEVPLLATREVSQGKTHSTG